jgi:hypothetical protein
MSLSESCSCGAGFSADREDELNLLNQWRARHKCPKPVRGDLGLTSVSELAPDYHIPEMHIGFRGDDDD